MKAHRTAWNRRVEPRYSQQGDHIVWRGERPRSYAGRGRLHNVSVSGLGFVAERTATPQVGQEISVYWKAWGDQALYQVVRVEPCNERTMLIGCRRDPAAAAQIDRAPKDRRPGSQKALARSAPTPIITAA